MVACTSAIIFFPTLPSITQSISALIDGTIYSSISIQFKYTDTKKISLYHRN